MEAQSQEEFVKRLETLPKHVRDVHEWEGGRCDFHPLCVCTCKGCKDPEQLQCRGEPYKTRLKLVCDSMHCCMRFNAWKESNWQAN